LLAVGAVVGSSAELAARFRSSDRAADFGAGLETSSKISPLNWRFLERRGDVLRALGENDEAARVYRRALDLNPACAKCAVGLAEISMRAGEDPAPWIERAIRYGKSDTQVRMNAAILYARSAEDDRAAAEFSKALLGHKEFQHELFRVFHQIYSPEFVRERIVPTAALERYLKFGLRNLDAASVRATWAELAERGIQPSDPLRRGYVEFLLEHGLVHAAWEAQFGSAPPRDHVVVNGSFEDRDHAGAMGWRILDHDNVRADVRRCPDCADRGNALRLRFSGEHNPNYFGTYQYVPVVPGALYRLKARARADGITSASAPFIAIRGAAIEEAGKTCEMWAGTEPLGTTTAWRDVAVEFSVPWSCEGVQIVVARPRTRRLNQFIGGEFWVDDVDIELVADAGQQPAEKAAATPAWFLDGLRRGDLVEPGGDGVPGEHELGAGGDELSHVLPRELDGAREGLGESRRPLGDRVSVARHGVEDALPQHGLRAALGVVAPDAE
jgi:hypothetical protein